MPTFLQKRRRRWYAILEIPKPLRTRLGKPRYVKSLETDSRVIAERRVLPIVTAWKNEIARARDEPVDDDAAFWRRALRNARTDEQRQAIMIQIEDEAWEIGAINVENIGELPSTDPEAQRFHGKATGSLVPFMEHLDDWLGISRTKTKTQDRQRSDVVRFAREFEMVQDVARPEVQHWINKLMTDDGISPKTVQHILSGLRGFWRYLQSIGVADEDVEPFARLDIARHAKRTSPRSVRQPFEPSDVVKLLDAAIARGDDKIADLIRLAMWTGCRIEELCSLKIQQVKDGHFVIEDAKTKAGLRDVPIHSELQQTMARLVDQLKDGYVLSSLTTDKYGARSNGLSSRFGKLKTSLGFGLQLVFHSIRKTVVTIFENAGVPENVVADIVGHEKTTMTYGLYSGGVSLAVKREALDKLAY